MTLIRQDIEALLAKAEKATRTSERLHYESYLTKNEADFTAACSPERIAALCRQALKVEGVIEALRQLRIEANRLCDRQLGGSYEDDCWGAIARADAALEAARDRAPEEAQR